MYLNTIFFSFFLVKHKLFYIQLIFFFKHIQIVLNLKLILFKINFTKQIYSRFKLVSKEGGSTCTCIHTDATSFIGTTMRPSVGFVTVTNSFQITVYIILLFNSHFCLAFFTSSFSPLHCNCVIAIHTEEDYSIIRLVNRVGLWPSLSTK
jgi:hypothetical protein